jgi:hypothetical protein
MLKLVVHIVTTTFWTVSWVPFHHCMPFSPVVAWKMAPRYGGHYGMYLINSNGEMREVVFKKVTNRKHQYFKKCYERTRTWASCFKHVNELSDSEKIMILLPSLYAQHNWLFYTRLIPPACLALRHNLVTNRKRARHEDSQISAEEMCNCQGSWKSISFLTSPLVHGLNLLH